MRAITDILQPGEKVPMADLRNYLAGLEASVSKAFARVPLRFGQKLNTAGDSITYGTGASASSRRWSTQLCGALGLTENNIAVAGKGVWYVTNSIFALMATALADEGLAFMAGHNDIYRGGADAGTLAKIEDHTRVMIAAALTPNAIPATNGAVTYTGTWTTYLGGSARAAQLGGNGKFATTAGAKASWTFNGPTVAIGLHSGKDATAPISDMIIKVDNVVMTTFSGEGRMDAISDGADNQKLGHAVVVLTGLGSGSHTVEVVLASATYGYVDWFGTLTPPNQARTVLVGAPPFVADGRWTAGGAWTPEAMQAASDVIEGVCAEFADWPVRFVPVNGFFDPNATPDQVDPDDEHPNDLGHNNIKDAFLSVVASAPPDAKALAVISGATANAATGGYRTLSFSTVVSDPAGLSDASHTSRLKARRAGLVYLRGLVYWEANTTGVRQCTLFKNGNLVSIVASQQPSNPEETVENFGLFVNAAAGDYFEIKVVHTAGVDLDIGAISQFSMEEL